MATLSFIKYLGDYSNLEETITYVNAFVHDLCCVTPQYSPYQLNIERVEFWREEHNYLCDIQVEYYRQRENESNAQMQLVLTTPPNLYPEE